MITTINNMNQEQRYISRQEAANILGVSPQTISNYLGRGYIDYMTADRVLFIDKESFESFVENYFEHAKAADDIMRRIDEDIKSHTKKVEEEERRLKEWEDAQMTRRYYNAFVKAGFGRQCLIKLFESVIGRDAYGKNNFSIVARTLDGASIDVLHEDYGITKERVRQKLSRAMYKLINHLNEREQDEKDFYDLQIRNNRLHDAIKERDEFISKLEKKISHYEEKQRKGRTRYERFDERRKAAAGVLIVGNNSNEKVDILVGGISRRLLNCLKYGLEITNLYDICCYDEADYKKCRNFGRKTLTELTCLVESLSRVLGHSYYLGCFKCDVR